MIKKKEIMNKFNEMEDIASTSRTEMGFQFTISQQLERIALVKSMIAPSDNDNDFIEEVLMFEQCLSVLEDLLINEVDGDDEYGEILDEIKEDNEKTISFSEFMQTKYRTSTERRDAIETRRGNIRYNRYRSEKKIAMETKRWRGLIKLMKRHNLLLKRKVWEDE